MKNKWTKDALFSGIVSPEMLILLAIPACGYWFGKQLSETLSQVSFTVEKLQWLATVPVAMLGLSISQWRNILSPEHDKNDIYQKWPDYAMVRVVYYFGLGYQVIYLGIASSFFLFDLNPVSRYGIFALAGSVIGSMISYGTIFHAQVIVRRSLDNITK